MSKENGIVYQNKDIMSKVSAEEFKGKSFEAYGVKLPRIIDTRPTELAAVEANELRLDRLFLLEDQSYLIVDYESDYVKEKKLKYLGYVARLVKTLYNDLGYYPRLKILIIYTADVTRGQTNPDLDIGTLIMHLDEAFLSEIDGESVWQRIYGKLQRKESLDDVDMMQLIIYPLIFKNKAGKQAAIQKAVELSNQIPDERKKIFALKGLLVFCDKVIQKEDAEKIRGMLMLTQVEQIIEREKQDAINEAVEATTREVTEKVTQKVTKRVTRNVTKKVTRNVTQDVTDRIAINLLKSGSSPEYVANNTGLSVEAVLKLQAKL